MGWRRRQGGLIEITPSHALQAHPAAMSRLGINLVKGEVAREKTGHRPYMRREAP